MLCCFFFCYLFFFDGIYFSKKNNKKGANINKLIFIKWFLLIFITMFVNLNSIPYFFFAIFHSSLSFWFVFVMFFFLPILTIWKTFTFFNHKRTSICLYLLPLSISIFIRAYSKYFTFSTDWREKNRIVATKSIESKKRNTKNKLMEISTNQ